MQPLPMLAPALHAPPSPQIGAAAPPSGLGWKACHLLTMTGLVFASYKRSGWVTRHQRGPKIEAPTSTNNEMKEFRKKFLKKFGEDAIVNFDQTTAQVPVFSTGALTLDLALGGGLPYGKLVEVYGPEQSGKTTLALSCCVSLQKSGRRKNCAFIDVEHALNTDYARQMGLDLDHFTVTQPNSAEEALDQANAFASSHLFDIIVIDSVAQLVPQEEGEKTMGERTIGLRARLLSQFCRIVIPELTSSETTVMCINQLRANIGGYGLSEDTVGGKAIKYAASVRMEVRSPQSGKIGPAEQPTGIRSKVKVLKNKLAAPYRTAEYDMIFGKGISWTSCLVEAGLSKGLIQKSGAWFVYKEQKVQGKEKMTEYFEDHDEERQELEDAIRSQSQSSPKADAEVVDLEVETDAAAVTKKDTVAKASKASKASKAASKASKAEE